MLPVAELGGGHKGRTLPGAQLLSISCSFWENLAKSYVGAPPPPGELAPHFWEVLDPPLAPPARRMRMLIGEKIETLVPFLYAPSYIVLAK